MKRLLLPLLLICCNLSAANIWLETENFSEKGGWVVDQQFMDLMGSPYLMAHGMGQPVPDASTAVDIPHKGKWHVYVRTFNWTSPWTSQDGPGAFKVKVDGKTLKTVLGTKGDCWQWQYAGKASLDAGRITALLDQIHLPGQHWHAKAVEFWDVITVQQASGSSGIYSTYSNLNSLIDYVKTNATNPYKPSTVSDSQARVAKAAAHAACQKLIGVTDLVDFKNPPKSDSLTLPSVEEEDGGTY